MTVNDGHFYSYFKKGSLLWSDPKILIQAHRRIMWGMRRYFILNQNLMSTGFLSNIVLTCLYAQPSTF